MSDVDVPISAERLKTAKLAMRFLRMPSVRKQLAARGPLTTPIVLAEYETCQSEVQRLIECQGGAAEVLILIRRDEIMVGGIRAHRQSNVDDVPKDALRTDQIGPDITIGQVWETLQPKKQWDMSHLGLTVPALPSRPPVLANYQLAAFA